MKFVTRDMMKEGLESGEKSKVRNAWNNNAANTTRLDQMNSCIEVMSIFDSQIKIDFYQFFQISCLSFHYVRKKQLKVAM